MISVRTDIAVLIKMNVCPTMDMDRVRSELSLSYLPPDKVKVMLMCTSGQVHEYGRLLPLLVPRPTGNTSLLGSSLVRGDRHVRTRQRRLQSHLHILPWTGQPFFQLVLVVFLHMKEPLRRPHVSDQVYCSCPTGEQLGDDWKTCRSPPQCPEVHTEIVFPDLQHFFLIPGRLFEGRGVCAKMWGGGPMGGRQLCS